MRNIERERTPQNKCLFKPTQNKAKPKQITPKKNQAKNTEQRPIIGTRKTRLKQYRY